MTEEQLKWIEESDKKDDCTDAMLQALFFIDVCMNKGNLKSLRTIRCHFDQHRREFISKEDVTYITGKEKEQNIANADIEILKININRNKNFDYDINLSKNDNKIKENEIQENIIYHNQKYHDTSTKKVKMNFIRLFDTNEKVFNKKKQRKFRIYKNKKSPYFGSVKSVRLKNGSFVSPYFI